ncbi:hypothetical protein [Phormidium sp. FACHB-322]|nr:hypothetical protein [Phormidium sp. FACHB-322]MBD2032585.1 hypothetical protein [Phormidium sp. FACHB-322]MBD2049443.1 hypothetical protein [Leptolyngbya sp. FACHB-60]
MRSTLKQRQNGTNLPYIDAEKYAELMLFDCDRIINSDFGWPITMEK